MKIKAAILTELGAAPPYAKSRPLTIETLDLDPPGEDEVLVKIKAAGLCHSDLSVINGSRPRPVPMALGHEAAGIVAGVGSRVTDLKDGDHVVLLFVPSCGHCLPCATGRPALCEPAARANGSGELISGKRRLHRGKTKINHHLGVSAFAEYAVVSRNSVIKIDPDLAFDKAALFGCAVITGVGAVLNTADQVAGKTVAVIGLGGVGFNAVLGARLAGARRILAVDLLDQKLDMAKQLGATDTFNAGAKNCTEQIRRVTDGGIDYAFEMAGSIPALSLGWNITRRGGQVITAGLPHPDETFALPAAALVGEEKSIKGSYLGSCVPARDVPAYIDLYRAGRLPLDGIVSDQIELDDINEGFDRLATGTVVRQIIVF